MEIKGYNFSPAFLWLCLFGFVCFGRFEGGYFKYQNRIVPRYYSLNNSASRLDASLNSAESSES